jgi:hypothetical protein
MTAIRLFVIAAHKSYSNRTANTRRQIQINSVEQPWVSCHVPGRAVSSWIVSTMCLMLFFEGR